MRKGYIYILECSDMTYYTGSTVDLEKRIAEHSKGNGANYTSKRLPIRLVHFEEYPHIAVAFKREKQIQRWSHKKKEALINGEVNNLKFLSECQNESHYLKYFEDSL